MYKNILPGIDHVAIWPLISLSIFFVFFIVLLWWVFTADKAFIDDMSQKPLQDGSELNHDADLLNL
jgi:cytochrome c oxidase cbb3-type subunit IV